MERAGNQTERETLILAALLHDIGKFWQRTKEKPAEKRHQEWGAEWLEQMGIDNEIVECVRFHHKLKREDTKYPSLSVDTTGANNNWLIFEADNLASGERLKKKAEDTDWDSNIPLMSVFSKITLPDKEGEQKESNNCWRYLSLLELDRASVFYPQDRKNIKIDRFTYENLWKRFEQRFKKNRDDLSPTKLINLLEKYTSFIPSETLVQKEPDLDPDVSLFDHSKNTAAIASCLYNYFTDEAKSQVERNERWLSVSDSDIVNRRDKRYLFIAADFSGIQDFIYTITSEGALKGLRGRSFYLELLIEHIVSGLLGKLALSRANIIYSGGGGFYIIAQNTEKAKKNLENIRQDVNRWLLNEHNGKLYLALDWMEFCGNAFITDPDPQYAQVTPCKNWEKRGGICKTCYEIYGKEKRNLNIGDIWEEIGRKLTTRKSQKFVDQMTKEFFEPVEPKRKACVICKKDFEGRRKSEVCKVCEDLQQLGGKLPKIRWIKRSDEPGGKNVLMNLQINGTYYQLWEVQPSFLKEREIFYVVNPEREVSEYGAIPFDIGSYPNQSKEFADLAKASIGAKKLSSLRMDVDYLGKIFACGLKDSKLRTISRITTLSRFLSYFFKAYLNQICKGNLDEIMQFTLDGNKKARSVVIIYSGGDDLFISGAWNDVMELALDIRRAFKKCTCDNPDINISGGMVVTDHKFPLYKIADLAGEAEDKAKDNRDEKDKKDSVTPFYTPILRGQQDTSKRLTPQALKWDEWEETIAQILQPIMKMGKFEEDRFNSKLSRAFIYNMFIISDIWQKQGILHLPKLAYILKQTEKPELTKDKNWSILKSNLMRTRYIAKLKLAMTWLDLLVRGGEEK